MAYSLSVDYPGMDYSAEGLDYHLTEADFQISKALIANPEGTSRLDTGCDRYGIC